MLGLMGLVYNSLILPFSIVPIPDNNRREYVHGLGLKSRQEWTAFCKGNLPHIGTLPEDIPATPHNTYKKKGWKGMGDWLGTGKVTPRLRKFRLFSEARDFVHGLGLQTVDEWRRFCKGEIPEKGTRPEDIPSCPHFNYKYKGWISWGDWLGTGSVATSKRPFRKFGEAKQFVRDLGIRSNLEWRKYCNGKMLEKGTCPDDIPRNPNRTYKVKDWISWGDWLGTDRVATTKVISTTSENS